MIRPSHAAWALPCCLILLPAAAVAQPAAHSLIGSSAGP
jgi:hypothetical protein